MKAFIRHDDKHILCFEEQSENDKESRMRESVTANAKAKISKILGVGESVRDSGSHFIDDDHLIVKQFWDNLERIYTTISHRAVANMNQKLK